MRFHGRDLRKGRVNLPGHTYALTCMTLNRTAAFAEWSSASLLAQEILRIGQSRSSP